jgi:hypothetical protein
MIYCVYSFRGPLASHHFCYFVLGLQLMSVARSREKP